VAVLAAVASFAAAAEPLAPGLEPALEAWREIPVLEDGRLMPLDTFARRHLETICNGQSVRLQTGPADGSSMHPQRTWPTASHCGSG